MGLSFAVMREDPAVELEVVRRFGCSRALIVASGGCTGMALQEAFPELEVVLYDRNPVQIAHVRARSEAVVRGDSMALNIGSANPEGLSQCGAFERLFRVLVSAVRELVVTQSELEAWFEQSGSIEEAQCWFSRPYWPEVFQSAFHDGLLSAMFGPDAVQHAQPGSYPGYFQRAFERGFTRSDGPHNPFLQHVFLGRYLERDAPSFLHGGKGFLGRALCGELLDIPRLDAFDLIHLSNIFDWSDDARVAAWGTALQVLRPGSVITIRQLNNQRAVLPPGFALESALSRQLEQSDRSLFYERILVARRMA